MRAILRCDQGAVGTEWDLDLLGLNVGGLSLMARHVAAFREAGIEDVEIWADEPQRLCPLIAGLDSKPVLKRPGELRPGALTESVLEQRADTLLDPRLIRELTRRAEGRVSLECMDRFAEQHLPAAKSPYRVGTPDGQEARLASPEEPGYPIGLRVYTSSGNFQPLSVGRYFWHRFSSEADAPAAVTKILLGTFKSTDGVYARTNRRVSTWISRRLLNTSLTPNVITLLTLLVSALAAALFATGSYLACVAGGVVSWAACMLDGVDGELARARFQSSSFGDWLEMVCDYLYYVLIFSGIGAGLYRLSGNLLWLWMGFGSALGALLSFGIIAKLRRVHKRKGTTQWFADAFQGALEQNMRNPVNYFLRRCHFLATRAAIAYYIFVFVLFDFTEALMLLIFFGTTVVWVGSPVVFKFFRPTTAPETRGAQ